MKPNKNRLSVRIDENSINDLGKGKIRFGGKGLTITDNNPQWNGTKYDISTMNIAEFGNKVTINHSQKVQDIVGVVVNTKKIANHRVAIDGIDFAVDQNANALFAYNMMKSKYLTDVSIETIGDWPDDDGVYKNSNLVGLSLVVVGNNKSAKINQVAKNSIDQAKELGLDTSIVEQNFMCYDKSQPINNKNHKKTEENPMEKYKLIKNSREFAIKVSYKNSKGQDVTVLLPAGESLQVLKDEVESVEKQINAAQEPKKADSSPKKAPVADQSVAIQAIQALTDKVATLETQLFDNGAREPMFQVASNKVQAEVTGMSWQERGVEQINNAWDWLKGGDLNAKQRLDNINKVHLEDLKKKGIVPNTVTIADMGNYVLSSEQLTQIEGFRSDFQPLLRVFPFTDTLRLQMAWMTRVGDISMDEVEMCDDGADGNLKPISEYTATINQSNLHELAAVTPVCDAATRFLVIDLLGDVAQGYRTDYDRKRAQLVVARLQQAVNSTGNKLPYSVSATVGATALQSFIALAGRVAERVDSGVWIMNTASYYELMSRSFGAAINTESGIGWFTAGKVPALVGRRIVVVPNELLPSLNTGAGLGNKTYVVEGTSVTIDQAVFYADPSTWEGRTSGGLKYDLSTDAAYEVGGVVKSAFQRNELLLRGSFFRGGAIKDPNKVASMGAPGIS